MKNILPVTSLCLLALATSASAVVVGFDTFVYPDGNIDLQAGGSGWDYATAGTSDWNGLDFGGGAQNVSGGSLVTGGGGALREYDADEFAGAAKNSGIVFFRFDITRSSGSEWSGASSMDFGAERVFFGVPGADFANDTAGLEISVGGNATPGIALTSISLTDGVTNTLVGVLDFDNDLVGLFVNPTGFSDYWNPADGSNSADATLAYDGDNWSSAIRLASGGPSGSTAWDNVTVALNDPNEVLLSVPEPTIGLLGGLMGLFLLRRRR